LVDGEEIPLLEVRTLEFDHPAQENQADTDTDQQS